MIFKRLNIFLRIQLLINTIIIIVFTIVGILVYYSFKEETYTNTSKKMYAEIDELTNIIDIYRVRDRDLLSMAANLAEYKINEYSDFEESDSATVDFEAVNPLSKEIMNIKINEWFVDEMPLLNNFYIVDEIKLLARVYASIYQKTSKGYVNVSTNIINTQEDRMLGDIILNSSDIVQTIESGNTYKARLKREDSWYQVIYRPVYINGKVRGMYYVGLKERLGRALKKIFDNRKYFNEGYAFIITKQGRLSIHPKEQGMDFSNTLMFNELIKQKSKKATFKYTPTGEEESKSWYLSFKYEKSLDSYICITYPEKGVFSDLNKQAIYIIIWFGIFLISFVFIMIYINDRNEKKAELILKSISKIAKNGKTEIIISKDKEYRNIYDRINIISEKYASLVSYANNLVNGKYAIKNSDLLKNDTLGIALSKLNKKLIKVSKLEKEGEQKAILRKWESDGLSKFIGILQQNTDNIQDLSYELINNLVIYLNANQGALFFINNENPNDVFFEQMATYAYSKKRLVTKKIYPEEGLIGRVYNEKKTIYLSEIPQNYLKITSGLGELEPNYLLIVPLLLNMEMYGAIEIASFNKFEDYQIEFVEKIGENIASTINNVQINTKTRKLLEQSREYNKLNIEKNTKPDIESARR